MIKNIILFLCLIIMGIVGFLNEPISDTIDIVAGSTNNTYDTKIDLVAGVSDDDHDDDDDDDDDDDYDDD